MMTVRSIGAVTTRRAAAVTLLLFVATSTAVQPVFSQARASAPREPYANSFYEQTYLAGVHSFAFDREFPRASRLFNAFDYGHSILYERLWRSPNTAAVELEGKEFDFLTKQLLVKPPRLPMDEAAIGPEWSLLAPEVLEMFEWTHLLHRQMYDVLAHDASNARERDAHMADLLKYYKSRPALAFSSSPKAMSLMEGQDYSLAFRKQNPKFNGLIWSYHWLQMTIYDALLAGGTKADREANVNAVVDRFYAMINTSDALPAMMPMSPAIAPMFTALYPEAAIIFDNLHSLHDVVSDILANPNVPRAEKRNQILMAASRYRDSSTSVTSVGDWLSMSTQMGASGMGGAPPIPRRTSGDIKPPR